MKLAKDTINLLPRQVRKSAERKGDPRLFIAIVFALAWVVAFGAKLLEQQGHRVNVASLESQKQAIQLQYAALQKDLGMAVPAGMSPRKASLIQHLLGERVLWSEVFRQFSRSVPRGLWFDSLEGNAGGKSEIRIRGGALSYATISEFMLGLERSSYFDRPRLQFAQKSVVRDHDVVGFEITCAIRKNAGGTP